VVDLSVCVFGDVVMTGDGTKGRFVGVEGNKEYFKVWMDDCGRDGEESCGILHFTKEGRCLEGGHIGRIVKVEKIESSEVEYLERLNELSTENILLRKMLEKALGRVRCSDITGNCCSECYMRSGEERLGCLRAKLEEEVMWEIYGGLK
jgi:hypothetical protein